MQYQTQSYYKKKKCESIPSFGLIPFCRINSDTEDDGILFLIQQRRDTFEYAEFMQGLWTTDSDLIRVFSAMTEDERERLRNYTFNELWDDMWVNRTCRMYKEGFTKAKQKYESISDSISSYLQKTTSSVSEPPWSFPKGRKNSFTEKDYDCAMREAEEETNIPKSTYVLYPTLKFPERFQGSNGVCYSTLYFLCDFGKPTTPEKINTPLCIRKISQSEEVWNLMWVPYKKACKYLGQRHQAILFEALCAVKNMRNRKTKDISEER